MIGYFLIWNECLEVLLGKDIEVISHAYQICVSPKPEHIAKTSLEDEDSKRPRQTAKMGQNEHNSQSSVPGLKKIQQFKDTMGRFHMTAVYIYRTQC